MGKVVAIMIIIAVLVIAPLLGALGGAFAGWVVGWFFSETVLSFMAALGIKDLAMWQIGLCLGFIGGFFKATQTNTNG
jgi:hypothetical protein